MPKRSAPPTLVALWLLGGCLPTLPTPLADDGTDGSDGTIGDDGSGTGDTGTADDPTADDGTADDGTTATGTTGGTEECGPLDALDIYDGDNLAVGNCHIYAEFDAGAKGLTSLRTSPDSDVELLYDGPAADTKERLAGVLQFEVGAPVVSWDGSEPGGAMVTHVLQYGQAMHRVEVWSHTEVGSATLEVQQIYTTLADGRMLRHDQAHVVASTANTDGLGSYVALRTPAFTDVHWDDGAGPYSEALGDLGGPTTTALFEGDASQPTILCAANYDEGLEVGFARFEDPRPPNGQAYIGTRLTLAQESNDPGNGSVRLQADWHRDLDGELFTGMYAGEMLLTVAAGDPDDPCARVSEINAGYQDYGRLQWIDGYADVGAYVGAEGFESEHFSPGGGFYYVAYDGLEDTSAIEVELAEAATQPTLLLYVSGLQEVQISGIEIDDTELSWEGEFLTQPAVQEGGGGSGGLDDGAFLLIGVPVSSGERIKILL